MKEKCNGQENIILKCNQDITYGENDLIILPETSLKTMNIFLKILSDRYKREKFFGNAVFKSLKGVEDKLVEAALFYENNQQIIESITGWDWIIDSMDKAQKVICLLHLNIRTKAQFYLDNFYYLCDNKF